MIRNGKYQMVPSHDSSMEQTSLTTNEENPPEWFIKYMKKFRAELMEEISQMIDQKLTRSHHHVKPCTVGAIHREVLSSTDFKCLKIEKKLQKLQKRTQVMSLEMEEIAPSPHKSKGERKLTKTIKRMEHLEAKKSKLEFRKNSRAASVPQQPSAPMVVDQQPEAVQQTSFTQEVDMKPLNLYDALVLSEGETPLHVPAGSYFTKTWIVKNNGEFSWNDKVQLRLAHASAGLMADVERVFVPILRPGDEGEISVKFQAPPFPGLFETYWHLYNGDDRFGQWLSCSVSVDPIPGEQGFESTPMCNSTLTLHPAIKEIKETNLTGSQIEPAKKDKGEYESDHEDDEDDDEDSSSDSDESDSFVHIPMPKCYQYRVDEGDVASCASTSANPIESMSSLAISASALPTNLGFDSCIPPSSTPRNAESEEEPLLETTDSTQIKYPVLDLEGLTHFPPMPPPSQYGQQCDEQFREASPVQILPEGLVNATLTVAAKAFNQAEAIMKSIHSSSASLMSSPSATSIPNPIPESAAADPASMTDVRTQNLITLAEMGFYDARMNEELLSLHNDNLQDVVAKLLARAGKTAP